MDVSVVKSMIQQNKLDAMFLDRVHTKTKAIETNLKNFKLKERSAFEQLVDEEMLLEQDLTIFEEKMKTWGQEPCAHSDM